MDWIGTQANRPYLRVLMCTGAIRLTAESRDNCRPPTWCRTTSVAPQAYVSAPLTHQTAAPAHIH
eukprot:365068-Chlamydomonas_euryale.AAC.2